MIVCAKVLGNFDDVPPATALEILPATCSPRWYFPEEERMMQYSRDKYFPQLRTKVINPVGEASKTPLKRTYTHKSKHLHPTQIRGLSILLAVICKD